MKTTPSIPTSLRSRAACATLLFLAGCGGSGGAGATEDAGRRDGSAAAGLCAPALGEAVPLLGEWAVRASLLVDLTKRDGALVTLCPSPQTAAAALVLHVEVTGTEAAPVLRAEICDIELPIASGGVGSCPADPLDNLEIAISLGAELRRLLPTVPLESPVAVSAGTSGANFSARDLVFVSGVALDDPRADALPAWDLAKAGCGPSDARPDAAACVTGYSKLRDSDGDGQVGVALEAISGDPSMVLRGKAFVSLRVSPRLDGTLRNARCIEGTFDSRLEYEVAGSDLLLSGAPLSTPAVIQNIPGLVARPTSTFRMIRADGAGELDFDDDGDGAVSCAEIARHAAVFSR